MAFRVCGSSRIHMNITSIVIIYVSILVVDMFVRLQASAKFAHCSQAIFGSSFYGAFEPNPMANPCPIEKRTSRNLEPFSYSLNRQLTFGPKFSSLRFQFWRFQSVPRLIPKNLKHKASTAYRTAWWMWALWAQPISLNHKMLVTSWASSFFHAMNTTPIVDHCQHSSFGVCHV
jgi:hypothetical protein